MKDRDGFEPATLQPLPENRRDVSGHADDVVADPGEGCSCGTIDRVDHDETDPQTQSPNEASRMSEIRRREPATPMRPDYRV